MNITRAIPEIRSTNIDKTVRFYTELLGFDTNTDNGRVLSFVSATHDGVEIIVNSDNFVLPPGFTIEVATRAMSLSYSIAPGRTACASLKRSETTGSRSWTPPAAGSPSLPRRKRDPRRPPVTWPGRSRGPSRDR